MSAIRGATSGRSLRYGFGPFVLEPEERRLLRDGRQIDLPPKAFDTLVVLVENSGRLVTKDQLLDAVWPDVVVEENYVSVNISRLRAALGETAQEWSYIETVPRSGYRFARVVQLLDEPKADDEVVLVRRTRREVTSVDQPASPRRMRTMVAISALGLILLIAGLASFALRDRNAAPQTISSVAVLPLQSMGRVEMEGLGLALADALITSLGGASDLEVRPTSSVLLYEDAQRDPVEAGRALGVDAVLDGRVQQADGQLRITLQLVGTHEGMTRWSGAFSAPSSNLIAVQDSLAAQAIRALASETGVKHLETFGRRRTNDQAAQEAYLRGRFLLSRRTGSDLRESLVLFRQAVTADPSFALAHASMAEVYSLLAWYAGVDPHEAFPRARAAAALALELDSTLAEAYVPLATTTWVYDRDPDEAEQMFRRALELEPNQATVHQGLGQLLALTNRLDEGLQHLERARELDPLSPVLAVDAATAFLFNGHVDEAIRRYRSLLDIDSEFALAHVFLGVALAADDQPDAAVESLETAIALGGRVPLWLSSLGHAYAAAGRPEEARRILDELDGLSDERFVNPSGLVLIHEALGEREAALDAYLHAERAGDPMLIFFASDPRLEDFRNDLR